jgi:leader peptidase (prepilin peptidase)/N-methyltransferase
MTPPETVAVAGALLAGAVDARTGFIPDAVTRTAALGAAVVAAASGDAAAACAGAYAVAGVPIVLYLVTGGRGLGLGDVKLAVAIGTGLGAAHGVAALGAAFVLGGAAAAWLLVTRRARRGDALRFGPFLAAGTLVGAMLPSGAPA